VSPSRDSSAEDLDPAGSLAVRLAADIAALDSELAEIELLVTQAGTEATRHEQRRAQTADKLAIAADRFSTGGTGNPKELADLATQLVAVARKSALMEDQIAILEGKRTA
jgi:predicted  nucleic acid-binding Zn-ribbon protein